MTSALKVYAGPKARARLRECGLAASDVRVVPAAAGGPKALVLNPHFQTHAVPGWLDKALRHRHAATARLANVVRLAPSAAWVEAALPGGKLPDRGDFKACGDDFAGRVKAWTRALAESRRLADEFAALVQRRSIEALPLP